MTGPPPVPDDDPSSQSLPGVGARTAAVLVFTSSAAVLVVEITALRLLAPYLGLTLETSTWSSESPWRNCPWLLGGRPPCRPR